MFKKIIILNLAIILILAGLVQLQYAPKEPIIAKKMNYADAEEIIEYANNEVENSASLEIENNSNIDRICVSGHACQEIEPDFAKITILVKTFENKADETKLTNNNSIETIKEELAKIGIEENKIIVENFVTYPFFEFGIRNHEYSFSSITTLSVQVEDLSKLGETISLLKNSAQCKISNIIYDVSDIENVYSNVLEDALNNAKEKAEKLSGRNDLKIKCLKEENVYNFTSVYKVYYEGIENSLNSQHVKIEAKVKVIFR